ncbi:hypothetical protein T439DRAFT_74261 [Meredithblackwellia eburnea MCA 4105]
MSDCLELVVRYSSAKEVVLALDDRLAWLSASVESLGDEDDDQEEGQNDEKEGEEVVGQRRLRGLQNWVSEFGVLANLYVKTLPRVRTKKPGMFLSTAIAGLEQVITPLALMSLKEGRTGREVGAKVWSAVEEFLTLANNRWTQSEEECLKQLQGFFLSSIAILHQVFEVDISHSFFLSRYPRYRIPGRVIESPVECVKFWKSIISRAKSLSLHLTSLFDRVVPKASLEDLDLSSLPDHNEISGSFILLTHLLSAESLPPNPNIPPFELANLLRKTMHIVLASLSTGATGGRTIPGVVGVDEALFWCWWCVEVSIMSADGREEDTIAEENVFSLVEVLSSLSALSVSPSIRFFAFRLLAVLVSRVCEEESTQLVLLKGLIEECPFESMRIAALGLLQEILGDKFSVRGTVFSPRKTYELN